MRCTTMNHIMKQSIVRWLVLFFAVISAHAVGAEPYKSEPGPYQVASFTLELQDDVRDREVPIKVYRPVGAEGARPVVLVSHGLGGTREGLSYLGKHWASHGYICVHMQHLGSDDSVWRDVKASERLKAMRRVAMDPANATNRAKDTSFVLDRLIQMHTDDTFKLHGILDLEKTAIAGHSFGAWTCMAAGGMTMGGRRAQQFTDERVRCMIPLSPPVGALKRWHQQSYGSLNIPALFMTGTLDTSAINSTTAEERLIPYRMMPGPLEKGSPKYLINFEGADHMTFSGETNMNRRLRHADPKTDPVFHSLILQSATAFLDCYLLGDQAAGDWLNGGGFAEAVGEHGNVEMQIK